MEISLGALAKAAADERALDALSKAGGGDKGVGAKVGGNTRPQPSGPSGPWRGGETEM